MKCCNVLRVTGCCVLIVFCRCDKYVTNATCHPLHGGLAHTPSQRWAGLEEGQLMASGGQSSTGKVRRQDGTLTVAKHEEKVLFSFMMKDNFSYLGPACLQYLRQRMAPTPALSKLLIWSCTWHNFA